jgi:hypothetical protein
MKRESFVARPLRAQVARSVAGADGLFQESTGRELKCHRQLFHGRYLGVAFTGLHAADLACLDTAALGQLFLGPAAFLAGRPQVGAEVAHAGDGRAWASEAPYEVLQIDHMKLYNFRVV